MSISDRDSIKMNLQDSCEKPDYLELMERKYKSPPKRKNVYILRNRRAEQHEVIKSANQRMISRLFSIINAKNTQMQKLQSPPRSASRMQRPKCILIFHLSSRTQTQREREVKIENTCLARKLCQMKPQVGSIDSWNFHEENSINLKKKLSQIQRCSVKRSIALTPNTDASTMTRPRYSSQVRRRNPPSTDKKVFDLNDFTNLKTYNNFKVSSKIFDQKASDEIELKTMKPYQSEVEN